MPWKVSDAHFLTAPFPYASPPEKNLSGLEIGDPHSAPCYDGSATSLELERACRGATVVKRPDQVRPDGSVTTGLWGLLPPWVVKLGVAGLLLLIVRRAGEWMKQRRLGSRGSVKREARVDPMQAAANAAIARLEAERVARGQGGGTYIGGSSGLKAGQEDSRKFN